MLKEINQLKKKQKKRMSNIKHMFIIKILHVIKQIILFFKKKIYKMTIIYNIKNKSANKRLVGLTLQYSLSFKYFTSKYINKSHI